MGVKLMDIVTYTLERLVVRKCQEPLLFTVV
jgi:hypothetical protein